MDPASLTLGFFFHHFLSRIAELQRMSVTVRAFFQRWTFVKLPFRSSPCKRSCCPSSQHCLNWMCSALGFQEKPANNKSLRSYRLGLLGKMKMITDEMWLHLDLNLAFDWESLAVFNFFYPQCLYMYGGSNSASSLVEGWEILFNNVDWAPVYSLPR